MNGWTDDGTDVGTQLAGDDAVAEVTRYFSRGCERIDVTYAACRIPAYNTQVEIQAVTLSTVLADGRTVTGRRLVLLPGHPERLALPPAYDVILTLDSGHELRAPLGTVITAEDFPRWDVQEMTHYYTVDSAGEPIDGPAESYEYEWIGDLVLYSQDDAEALMRQSAANMTTASLI